MMSPVGPDDIWQLQLLCPWCHECLGKPIIEGGPFAVAFAKLQATGFKLRWQSRTDDPARKKKAASKTKYGY